MCGHIEKMEAQLDSWSAVFEELVARADEAGTDKILRKPIIDLIAKHAAARDKLAAAKGAGEQSWERTRVDVWIAWNELENAFTDFRRLVLKRIEQRTGIVGESNEKALLEPASGRGSRRPGKRISTSIEMALLQLLEESKHPKKRTELTHAQIAERAYRLWQQGIRQAQRSHEREPQTSRGTSETLEEID